MGLGVLSGLAWARKHYAHVRWTAWTWAFACVAGGALVGAWSLLCVVGLMFFKTAWHSHLVPDYPLPMMAAMLARLPVWAVVGALVGAGFALCGFPQARKCL
jgi:hypothetical protein